MEAANCMSVRSKDMDDYDWAALDYLEGRCMDDGKCETLYDEQENVSKDPENGSRHYGGVGAKHL